MHHHLMKNPNQNAAVFAASEQVRRINSNVYLGINTISYPENWFVQLWTGRT